METLERGVNTNVQNTKGRAALTVEDLLSSLPVKSDNKVVGKAKEVSNNKLIDFVVQNEDKPELLSMLLAKLIVVGVDSLDNSVFEYLTKPKLNQKGEAISVYNSNYIESKKLIQTIVDCACARLKEKKTGLLKDIGERGREVDDHFLVVLSGELTKLLKNGLFDAVIKTLKESYFKDIQYMRMLSEIQRKREKREAELVEARKSAQPKPVAGSTSMSGNTNVANNAAGGVAGGVVNNSVGNATGGVAGGFANNSVGNAAGGVAGGTMNGVANNTTGTAMGGAVNGAVNNVAGGVANGMPSGTVNNSVGNATGGVANNSVGNATGGVADGVANNTTGTATGGAVDGAMNGAMNGVAGGTMNGVANGAADGITVGATGGAVDGAMNGAMNGVAGGTMNGVANGAADGITVGATGGVVDGAMNGAVNGAMGGEESITYAVNDSEKPEFLSMLLTKLIYSGVQALDSSVFTHLSKMTRQKGSVFSHESNANYVEGKERVQRLLTAVQNKLKEAGNPTIKEVGLVECRADSIFMEELGFALIKTLKDGVFMAVTNTIKNKFSNYTENTEFQKDMVGKVDSKLPNDELLNGEGGPDEMGEDELNTYIVEDKERPEYLCMLLTKLIYLGVQGLDKSVFTYLAMMKRERGGVFTHESNSNYVEGRIRIQTLVNSVCNKLKEADDPMLKEMGLNGCKIDSQFMSALSHELTKTLKDGVFLAVFNILKDKKAT